MKQIFIGAIALIAGLSSCQNQPALTIKGKISGDIEKPLIISVLDKDGLNTLDTLTLVDGTVDYTTHLDQPKLILMNFDGSRQRKVFFGENSAYTLEGNVQNLAEATLTGGQLAAEYDSVNELSKGNAEATERLKMEYAEARKAGDEERQKQIETEYEGLAQAVENKKLEYIKANPASPVAAFMVYNTFRYKSVEEMKEALANLDPAVHSSPYYKALSELVEKLEKVAVGQQAPDFTMNDTEGNAFSLSSLKGKYVLVDFWASWCGPCRGENPNVVKLYNDFKDQGFDILGVSLDQSKEDWLKAIADDQLTWHHVSDLKGWKNEVAQLYAVSSIPHTVLLDKEGRIIAKNLRGEELRLKVEELLKN